MSGSEDGGFEDSHMDSEDIQNDNLSEQVKKSQFVVPNSKTKLRACNHCRLIKSEEQWKNSKSCQNCGDLTGSVENQTSSSFTGIISILNDSKSWVRRKNNKLMKNKLVLGAYAVAFN